jgi:type II secretory pathway pseudopilin PulG
MGCQEPWMRQEQAERYKPSCQERRRKPVGLITYKSFYSRAEGRMPRRILAKTTGSTLAELMTVIVIISSLAAMAVPTFVTYRDRSRVTQVIGSSEAIRAALASYAAGNPQHIYPETGAITDFNSLRLVVNAHGGMLPLNAIFSVARYNFYDSDGDGIADTYALRLSVNGVSHATAGAQLLLTPEGIFKCTVSGDPC